MDKTICQFSTLSITLELWFRKKTDPTATTAAKRTMLTHAMQMKKPKHLRDSK